MACFSSWRTGFSLGSQLLVKMSRDQFLFVLAIVDELAKISFFFLVRSRAWKCGLLRVSVFVTLGTEGRGIVFESLD